MKHCLFVSMVVLASSSVWAVDPCERASYASDVSLAAGVIANPEPGRWTSDFVAATNKAAESSMPVLVVLGKKGCPCCNYLTDKALNSSKFSTWASGRQILMFHSTYDRSPAAYRWVRGFEYPFVGVYWPKYGTAVDVCFTGREGKMPVTTGDLADQLIASVEAYISEYGKATKWSFACGDTVGNRLEAETNVTKRVSVPLVRETNVGRESACRLVVSGAKGNPAPVTNVITWAVGQAETNVWVETASPIGGGHVPGEALELKLLGEEGEEQAMTHITFVEPMRNSPVNPQWIGEPFAFGKLTFDYDAATNAVAKKRKAGEKAYLIAFWTGALWCPYCKGMETSLMADARFYGWAASNNVALVEFDQGRASSPATAAGTLSPRLTTYEPDPKLSIAETVSGASYLSRHAVDPADTVAVRARTTAFTQRWLAPGSTSARLSQPTLLLIGQDEQVLGRLSASRDDAKVYDVAENIARLDDLLALAGRADESGDYALTTRDVLAVGVEDASKTNAVLQINRKTAAFVLDGLAAGTLTLTATAGGRDVTVKYVLDGVEKASAKGGLTVKVAKSHLSRRAVVCVSGSSFAAGGKTSYPVELTASLEPASVEETSSVPCFFTVLQMIEELIFDEQVRSVSVRKTEGLLPAGLRLAYDGATESICLSGFPSVAQETTIKYSYTVEYASGRRETSEPTEVLVSAFDPSDVNPHLCKALNLTLPLLAEEDGASALAGTLSVSQSSRGQVSAKLIGERSLSFGGRWQALDAEGTASGEFRRSTGERLVLSLDVDGLLRATVCDASGDVWLGGQAQTAGDLQPEDFAGSYVCALTNAGEQVQQSGHGLLRFKVSSGTGAFLRRAVTYAGTLPDGLGFSGSAVPSRGVSGGDYDYIRLPVFKKLGSRNLGVLARVRSKGAQTYGDEEDSGARVVEAETGVRPYWGEFPMELYGSWFCGGLQLSDWSAVVYTNHLASAFVLKIGGESVAKILPEGSRNHVLPEDGASLVTFGYARLTGLINGLAGFRRGDESLFGTWKAIAVPGWHYDCGCGDAAAVVLPFAMGTFVYTDRSGPRPVSRSLPVTLEPVAD